MWNKMKICWLNFLFSFWLFVRDELLSAESTDSNFKVGSIIKSNKHLRSLCRVTQHTQSLILQISESRRKLKKHELALIHIPIQKKTNFGGTMNSSSPAHSSLSTTAVVGGGGGGGGSSNATVSIDDFHLPCDPISSQERKDEAMIGGLHSIYFVVIFIQNWNFAVISQLAWIWYPISY